MHELAVAQSIVDASCERCGEAKVLRVTLEVGALSCVLPEALQFCYEVVTENTPLYQSELVIIRKPGRSRCRDCGREVLMFDLLASCSCGSVNLDAPTDGGELRIQSMEIEEIA